MEPGSVSCHLEPGSMSCHLEPGSVSCHVEPGSASTGHFGLFNATKLFNLFFGVDDSPWPKISPKPVKRYLILFVSCTNRVFIEYCVIFNILRPLPRKDRTAVGCTEVGQSIRV